MKQVCVIKPDRTKKYKMKNVLSPRNKSAATSSLIFCVSGVWPRPHLVRIRQPRSSKPRLLPATSSGETRKRGMTGVRGRGLGEIDLEKELRSAERVAPTRVTATHV
ncbi:hypothetical protein PoB_006090500 [Plakobranchus ocellatus]|uniref:Uncharacterized protein n=1 Tax=Plakobranchus ocellatus TaxID=259542 RepID=A0AAV4CRE6_9GAST|nr:hypothetical protein PoB_006090500 [Plakobranchus ocellatus]